MIGSIVVSSPVSLNAQEKDPAFRSVLVKPLASNEAEQARKDLRAARLAEKSTVLSAQSSTFQTTSSISGGISANQSVHNINELARALKYDADLIYDYVRNNVEFDTRKGLIRGGIWGPLGWVWDSV